MMIRTHVSQSEAGIYLQPNFDGLGESTLREYSLNLWDDIGADHAAFFPNQLVALANARHDGKVLWKVVCQNAGDSLGIQFFIMVKF